MSRLSDDQFGNTTYTAPNKRTYSIRKTGGRMVEALTPSGRAAGRMSWFQQGFHTEGPEIFKVIVSKPHQRKGVASAMLEMAQRHAPGLSHSAALSPEGAAWANARPLPGDSEMTKRSQKRVLEEGE